MAITIEAQKRDEAKNPRQIRREGFLPATIYGKGKESVSIQLDKRVFINNYKNFMSPHMTSLYEKLFLSKSTSSRGLITNMLG